MLASRRELTRQLGGHGERMRKNIVANPRLVATTITFGVNRVERKMPEKRPERKLTQRVVVNEAAWGWGVWLAKERPTIAIAFVQKTLACLGERLI